MVYISPPFKKESLDRLLKVARKGYLKTRESKTPVGTWVFKVKMQLEEAKCRFSTPFKSYSEFSGARAYLINALFMATACVHEWHTGGLSKVKNRAEFFTKELATSERDNIYAYLLLAEGHMTSAVHTFVEYGCMASVHWMVDVAAVLYACLTETEIKVDG